MLTRHRLASAFALLLLPTLADTFIVIAANAPERLAKLVLASTAAKIGNPRNVEHPY